MQTGFAGGSRKDSSHCELASTENSETTAHDTWTHWLLQITVPMDKLLKKNATFKWDQECQKRLDILKEKMLTASILVFSDWNKEFHVHVDVSCIALGIVLVFM